MTAPVKCRFLLGDRMSNYLVNGAPTTQLTISDRGYQYGDGFFTTIRVIKRRLVMWPAHWQRLCEAAQVIRLVNFSDQVDESGLMRSCQRLVSEYPHDEAVIRITVTRGSGGRGYAPSADMQANVVVSISAYPEHYSAWRQRGVRLQLAAQSLGCQPMLAGIKSLNRLEQVLLKHELNEYSEVDDLVALDHRGYVAETSMANIAWRQRDQWFTPRMEGIGVHGVAMQYFVQHTGAQRGDYRIEALLEAEQVIISNSLLGFVNVQSICLNATRIAHFSVLSDFTEQLTRRMCENE